ncbi:DNA repair protein RecO [Croceimicrobium hydrocarbonivorans]|uniref:DNA repair protein RecO n=1 Tax=Croceimicrobium hydrocarbonivorans TaxID=2761580 RepID=A0A7H0VJS1_9FLAO|nr:DNA repair protein RecO [Croceimicrobium hydrocarbonivorans]QNR25969.1 DNA repair protein RecO [Croceimicrobium hydrocarbonivorans]
MAEIREGIVLSSVPYGESRIILNLLTPDLGTIGLIATLSKKGKSGLKKAHFQNLQILEIQHAERNKGELKRLQDARILYPYQQLYFDPVLSCMALFLAEFLYKVLREEEGHPELYRFVRKALIQLDSAETGLANFHLAFLMELSAHLGLRPQLEEGTARYFDLLNSQLSIQPPDHAHFIEEDELQIWRELQAKGMENYEELNIKGSAIRRKALASLIDYYRLHLHDFGDLKSLAVLREVLA